MKKILFALFILCIPQQLYALTISYTFSGTATVHDNQDILLENFPSVVDFSGSFITNTNIVYDGGAGIFAYKVSDFHMLLNEYDVYGYSRSASQLYWSFNEIGTEIDLGYSSVVHDIPVDNVSWSELYLHFNVSPENADDFTNGSFHLLIVSDYASDIKDMYFLGDITNFESSMPVPEPSSAFLTFFGLIGLLFTSRSSLSQKSKKNISAN